MDKSLLKAVETTVAGAKAAVKNLQDSEIKARSYKGLQKLGDADAALDKALEKVIDAEERTKEKEPKPKDDKKK